MAVSRRNSSLGLQTSFKEQHRRMLASMSKCMLCMSKRAPSELVNKQPCCMLMQMQDCFTVLQGNGLCNAQCLVLLQPGVCTAVPQSHAAAGRPAELQLASLEIL